MQSKKAVDVRNVADRYDVHPSTVWRWAKQTKFPNPVRIGGATRWLTAELDEYDAALAADRDSA